MDDDADVLLQRVAADLVREFDAALVPFATLKSGRVRARVRTRDVDRMVGLLEPFQENPQLLDAHLASWLPRLADFFLRAPQTTSTTTTTDTETSTDAMMSTPRAALARLLYTFCKVRGEKVVVTFLPVEARHLEPLLASLEHDQLSVVGGVGGWTWQERYVVLLWLAQLLLAPFDLSTIGDDLEGEERKAIPGLVWPDATIPPLTLRAVPLALGFLASAGRERDAARALLVRVALRRDMQALGVTAALVKWALATLTSAPEAQCIGVLAFVAGLLGASAGAPDLDAFLPRLFVAVHAVAEDGAVQNQMIRSSAVARKLAIKALRHMAVRAITLKTDDGLVETTIGFLLEALADNDTPVRFAASKGLAVIALRLDPDRAAEVVDAVLDGLERNVVVAADGRADDLTSVDPLEWHGLVLALAHLLYRRAPPPTALPQIVRALQRGLAFERRSVSGSATGTNVRDAACFGVWALARRYASAELPPGTQQTLATDLVTSACLDPAGNIRRGSSAALQELIGRHPDTVCAGIPLVQVVDYHGVALRARAATDVAQAAAALAPDVYGVALATHLLGWRGVGDAGDTAIRRVAAQSYGRISAMLATSVRETVAALAVQVLALQPRQVEERHGLLLALASVASASNVSASKASKASEDKNDDKNKNKKEDDKNKNDDDDKNDDDKNDKNDDDKNDDDKTDDKKDDDKKDDDKKDDDDKNDDDDDKNDAADAAADITQTVTTILLHCSALNAARRPDLLAEAGSRLVVAALPVAQASGVATAFASAVRTCLALWLPRQEPDVVDAAADAAVALLQLATGADRDVLVTEWAAQVRKPGRRAGAAAAAVSSFSHRSNGSTAAGAGAMTAFCRGFGLVGDPAAVTSALLDRWASDTSIDARVALLHAVGASSVLAQHADLFRPVLLAALDDYTTDARGDVGSHVRLQALHATMSLSSVEPLLLLKILRLAAEKLDRVRIGAQAALAHALQRPAMAANARFGHDYFLGLLVLTEDTRALRVGPGAALAALVRGLVLSADTGNEELVVASRSALVAFALGEGEGPTKTETKTKRRARLWTALVKMLPALATGKGAADRVAVPALEVVAFLFHAGVFGSESAESADTLDGLVAQTALAVGRAGNVRKAEACCRVFGAAARAGCVAARRQLGLLLDHAWPHVRAVAVDELWALGLLTDDSTYSALKGVDWGVADVAATAALRAQLAL